MVLRNQPSTRVRYSAAIGEEGERKREREKRRGERERRRRRSIFNLPQWQWAA